MSNIGIRRNELKDTIINKYLEVEKMRNEEAIRLYKTGKNNVLKVMKVMLVENLMEETEARPVVRSKRRVIRPSRIACFTTATC
jgi:hypothetical protein